jgi:hypothetical protein
MTNLGNSCINKLINKGIPAGGGPCYRNYFQAKESERVIDLGRNIKNNYFIYTI